MCHNDLVFIAVSLSDTTLYPSRRSSLCFFFFFFHYFHVTKKKCYINKLKKKRPMKTWVKISKIMPHPNSPFPREREGCLMAKSPNLLAKIWYSLTVHIHFFILNLQTKFFKFMFCLLAKFPANYTNSVQFAPKNPANNAKLAPFIHYTLYFQMPDQQQRTL